MTQEEKKDLLLKDLCARLPYGVKGIIPYNGDKDIFTVKGIFNILFLSDTESCLVEDFKPYLFPLSSMTEEQLFEVQEILGKNEIEIDNGFLRIVDSDRNVITYLEILAVLEWFYKNHFDINDLIPKDLAIDATGLNIY